MSRILILGATSGIAKAVVHEFSRRGDDLIIAGRREEPLQRLADDLSLRYFTDVETIGFDALDYPSHQAFFEKAVETYGKLEGIVVAFGYLSNQSDAERDFSEAKQAIDTNFTAAVSILNQAAPYFESRQSGFICVLSSVAGERGRKSNYLYGAAKGGLSVYLQGLRHRLAKSHVSVTTVKPGFVDTKMTFGQEGMFLVASPESVAKQVVKAIDHGKATVYTPFFWRYIMFIIKSIPNKIFNQLDL